MYIIISMVVLTGGAAVVVATPPSYTVTVLQDPPGIATTSPIAVNGNGEVVGSIFNTATGFFDGARWDSDGSGAVLSEIYNVDIAEALNIRHDGTILAAAVENANIEVQHAAVLAPDKTVTFLPSLAGNTGVVSAAFDMNDKGIVVGRSALVATPFWMSVPNDAVFWEDGAITSIGTLGGFLGTARRINNNNIIIGESNTATSDLPRGFVWDEEFGMAEIPPLEPGEVGFVADINDKKIIVGSATLNGENFACIWNDYVLPPELLETLPGDGQSSASGINNSGHIVGSAATPQGSRARLWMKGKIYDINDLLAEPLSETIISAGAITDNGVILAHTSSLDVVLTPVPCPADFDNTGNVGVPDLLELLGNWGACEDCPADLDGDDTVGVSDLLELLGDWGACV